MPSDHDNEIDVTQLMQRIREGDEAPSLTTTPQLGNKASVNWRRMDQNKDLADGPLLPRLIDLHGADFVNCAYRELLDREPDKVGRDHYLSRLSAGSLSKIEVIGALRFSKEGRRKAVRLPGLIWKFLLTKFLKIPVLGQILSLPISLVRVPRLNRNLQALEQAIFQHREDLENRLSTVFQDIENNFGGVVQQQASLQEGNQKFNDQFQARTENVELNLRNLNNLTRILPQLERAVNDHGAHLGESSNEIEGLSKQLADTLRRVSELEQRLKSELRKRPSVSNVGKPASQSREKTTPMGNSDLDPIYVDLEDRFRGTRQEVKERLITYESIVDELASSGEWLGAVDIGCGRGEWLDILHEKGLAAVGVDLNEIMVEECKGFGYAAYHEDARNYLARLEDNSLSMISGFHILEHIPFPECLGLLQECYRVLKEDGVLLLETPNPQNLDVGSHNFYYDPTHANPIPPELGRFLVSAGGFLDVQVQHVNDTGLSFSSSNDQNIQVIQDFLSDRFSVAPDYALIARK